jgi:hypothetical protein
MACKNCGIETESKRKKYCCNECIQLDRRKKLLNKPTKICPKCKEELPISNFETHLEKRPYTSYCKSCINLWSKERLLKLTPEEKAIRLEHRRNYQYTSYKSFFKSSLITIKSRAKIKNIPFDICLQDLLELAEKQNYKCAISGEPLSFKASSKNHANKKFTASVDRIIPELGYIKTNIQLLIFQVNWMKSNLSISELYDMCKKIITTLEEKHEKS